MTIEKKRSQIINLSLSVALVRKKEVTEQEIEEALQEAGYLEDFSASDVSAMTAEINELYRAAPNAKKKD